ncbi:TetR family transcriptional regulator [Paenibacillus sp. MY03]|uniref:TetR/AcrR family transcriptional regulator n=1 Tax=Paenibacillus sp. MY03 TaxID=302980 RepID=UPI000B3C8F4F|nr:TetR/AcrR family transcriptional regulator [Paenibacillus sp. MY03]OUS78415.1 TetR family transcriptional regulator [Paenibacillus sp. MY03]
MNKKKQQTEQTKKRIADASKALFAQKGFKATSIEDIVKATGCSAGNIYYHFKSKEGLFFHLLDDWNREWEDNWLARESMYASTIDKLYGIAEHSALDHLNHPLSKAVDEFFFNADNDPVIEERINEMVGGYIEFNRQLLQQGIDNGELEMADVTGIATILDILMYGLNQHTRKMGHEEALAAYRLAMDVFLHGIAKRPR